MAAAANKDPRHDGKGKENNEGRQRKWAVKKRPILDKRSRKAFPFVPQAMTFDKE